MDENDLSIEKREPAFFASLFGAEPETVLVNSDGDVVGKIETEEPGFFGSLLGEEAKQVIVNEDGDKVASFEKEEPGFFGSLMGETAKTVLVNEEGDKLASFDTEEPGLLGSLLGEKAKTVLIDPDGDKLATFDREEPGFVGKLLGEKSKRLLRAEAERVAEIRRMLSQSKDEEADTSENDSPNYYVSDLEAAPDMTTDDNDVESTNSPSRIVIEENDDESVCMTKAGEIQVRTCERTSDGFNIITTTFKTAREYEHHLRIMKMVREMSEKDV